MKRKNILVILIICFCFINFIYSSDIKPKQEKFDFYKSQKLNDIFYELYNLIAEKQENNEVFKTISFIKEKIERKEVLLLVNKIPNNNILSGAYFLAELENISSSKPIICLNINQIYLFEKYKSIIFSMLIHEIRHAYDYYKNYGLFKVTDKNILESYLFQMDALYVEALLIENYLEKTNFNLTEYEKRLLDSHQKDNLATYSIIYEGVDMELIYKISRFRNDKVNYNKNINDLIEIGNNLINTFDPDQKNNEWEKYKNITTLYSFTRYITQITYEIYYNKKNKIDPSNFSLKNEIPKLFNIYKKGNELLKNYLNFYVDYRNNKIDEVENFEIVKQEDLELEKFEEEVKLAFEYYIINNTLLYIHVVPSKKAAAQGMIGITENKPFKLTKKSDLILKNAKNLYTEKKYKEAVNLLEKIIEHEPDNPFVLEQYARSLYWYDREKSFQYYKKLIDILETEKIGKYAKFIPDLTKFKNMKENKIKRELIELNDKVRSIGYNEVRINIWFPEAYWKIGTLYLDQKNYLMGAFEITRALICGIQRDSDTLAAQMYSYLCEAYYYLGKYQLAMHCGNIALQINPNSEHANYFVNMTKKKLE